MPKIALLAAVTCSALLEGQVNVLSWHNDNARTGQNLQETALMPSNVNSSTFGRLFVMSVDGKVDAEPVYVAALAIPGNGVHNVLYVVTEHDSAYALDADTGAELWHVTLLNGGETTSDDRGCSQVTPEIGITSTPAIDLHMGPHGTMYTVSMSKDKSGNYHHRLHALDLTTGGEELGGPVEVQATYPGKGAGSSNNVVPFDPGQYKERAGILISNGVVYTSWASHCDISPYTGWVIGYNAATLKRVSVMNLIPNGNDGAIWAAGAGPAADADGFVYALTGNGTFDVKLSGGFPAQGDYGNAFVKISTGMRSPSVVDYFTMSTTVSESGADEDLGSGGLMLMPQVNDSQGNPRSLAVGAGKDGNIYVVDTKNMGKFNSGQDSIYQQLTGALGGVWSSPAWFNGKLYYAASGDNLKAFAFTNGLFQASPVSQTAMAFPYPGGTPSISANGSSNGIVWVHENAGNAVLHAFDANDLTNELYNSNQAANGRDHFGSGNKFIVPMVVNGRVYVGTTNGVGVFGMLCGPKGSILTPPGAVFVAGGGIGTVSVPSGCPQTAASNAGFVQITGNSNGTISYSVSANSGGPRTGTITISGQTFAVSQAGTPPPVPGDFDGDGRRDLVVQDPASGASQVWFLGGAQNATVTGRANMRSGASWRIVAVADFNGDGHPDLVWQDPATGSSQVWFMGGAQGTTLNSSVAITGPISWRMVSAADFNGDGHPDLVWQDPATGRSQVWFMGGAQGTTLNGAATITGPISWRIVGAADFNGDGHPDLVWQDPATGMSQVWLMSGAQGTTPIGSAGLSAANAWRIVDAADLDGDGRPELIWQDPVTGAAQVWWMGGTHGTTLLGAAALSGATPWRIAK